MTKKPKELLINKNYLMQIVDAASEFIDCGYYYKYRYDFTIRIWPDTNDYELFVDVQEIFYDNGRCERYLAEFIENATGFAYREIDEADMIGAVFKGVITTNVKADKYGRKKIFFNLNAIKHFGYAEIEEVSE